MKKTLFRHVSLGLLCVFSLLLLAGCATKPEKGYVSDTYITENVIKKIDSSVTYSSYDATYLLNYFAKEAFYYPPKGENKVTKSFTDSPDKYDSKKCSSLFLNLPLHITKENWIVMDEKGEVSVEQSTKEVIERKIYQAGSEYDFRCYYYLREGGGFYLKVFATNKKLIFNQLYDDFKITCTAKWNITFEYDQNGFLLMEKFETINAHKEADTKSVYCYAKYSYQ